MTARLLTASEVADRLGCTLSAVRRWRREGRIRVVQLGRLIRVSETEIDAIIANGLRPSRAVKKPTAWEAQ